MTKAEVAVRRLAAEMGATLTVANDEVNVAAPDGYTWASAPDTHELINAPWDDQRPAEMWTEALDRMTPGLQPCTETACDWCRPVPVMHADDFGPLEIIGAYDGSIGTENWNTAD